LGYISRTANPKLPTLTVELWTRTNNAFTLNDPTLGRLNAGNFLDGTASQFEDVVCKVTAASWRRGSTSSTDFLEPNPGYATIQLYDPDRIYDPSNSASPKIDKLRVGSPVRISATWAGTTYTQYTGFLWSLDWQNDIATFTATDLFTQLARATLPTGLALPAGQLAVLRIADLIAAAGFAVPLTLSLPGAGRPMHQTLGSDNALSAIAKTVVSDWGLLNLKPDGDLTYGASWFEDLRSLWFTVSESLCDALSSATLPGIAYDRVRNDITATSTNPVISTRVTDQDSIDLYGRTSWSYQTVLQGSTDLSWWANLALLWYKQIPNRVPQNVVLDPQATAETAAALWPALLDDGLGKVISLDNVEGLDADAIAVGVTHNYDASSDSWQVFIVCAAHPLNYALRRFTLNGGTLGYLDYSNTLKT
jgi:hypothetical protein